LAEKIWALFGSIALFGNVSRVLGLI